MTTERTRQRRMHASLPGLRSALLAGVLVALLATLLPAPAPASIALYERDSAGRMGIIVNNNPLKYTDPLGLDPGHRAWDPITTVFDDLGGRGGGGGSTKPWNWNPSDLINRWTGTPVGRDINPITGGSIRPPPLPPRPSLCELDGGGSKGKPRTDLTVPGPHADESIAARDARRNFTAAERGLINEIGARTGCHSCGTRNPGTPRGNWVPDNQPPNAVNPPGGPQRLYPHCLGCSLSQGGQLGGRR